MRLIIQAFTAILLSLLLGASASGEPILPSGVENPMPVRFTGLLDAPAPSWLSEGVRATYSVIAGSSDTEHGESVDFGSGHAGSGLSQLDVVAIENMKAAITSSSFVPDSQGAMRQVYSCGSTSPLGCGDFWCSPDILAGIQDQAVTGLTVQRQPFDIDGRTCQAIRLDFTSEGMQIALVYDLDTGVLLYHTFDYQGYSQDGQNDARTSWGNHAIYQLVSLRQVEMPWKGGSIPSSLSPGQSLAYQGQTSIQVQGAEPVVTPMAFQVKVLGCGERYAELLQDLQDHSTGVVTTSSQKTVSGIWQFMGSWIPPEAIPSLAEGVLDTDPHTGMKVSLVQKDDEGVVFEKTNQQDFRELFTYDRSGTLVQAYYEYNPDVMTSSGFKSVKVITLQLVR